MKKTQSIKKDLNHCFLCQLYDIFTYTHLGERVQIQVYMEPFSVGDLGYDRFGAMKTELSPRFRETHMVESQGGLYTNYKDSRFKFRDEKPGIKNRLSLVVGTRGILSHQ